MTETPEIPEEAYERATDAIAALVDSWPSSASHPFHPELGVRGTLRAFAIYALEAAFPEPTFTASEVKELTTKATAVALALGRKEAATEVADAIRRSLAAHYSPGHDEMMIPHETAIGLALEIASRVPERGSEPLTAPTGHSDLPPTPECRGCGQDGTGLENHNNGCPQNPLADLPEGRDQ